MVGQSEFLARFPFSGCSPIAPIETAPPFAFDSRRVASEWDEPTRAARRPRRLAGVFALSTLDYARKEGIR